MPIRIYALAKQLKIDSKALVDVCKKAGVTGKGSALASLTDDEVEKLKAYLAGGGKKTKPAPSSPGPAPLRPSPRLNDGPITRDDYVAPGGGAVGKVANLDTRTAKERAATESEQKPQAPAKPRTPEKREPVIKLAAIPQQSVDSTPAPAADEPAPQKPIMTLPKDAIRGAREGSTAPLEQFTRQQEKRRRDTPQKPEADQDDFESSESREKSRVAKSKDRRHTKEKGGDEEGEAEGRRERGQLAKMGNTRLARQQSRKRKTSSSSSEQETPRPRRRARLVRKGTNTAAPRKGSLVVEVPCTIRSFSEATGVAATGILRTLMSLGTPVANINAVLDEETAAMLADDAGVDVEFRQKATLEEELLTAIDDQLDDESQLEPRPPIVTFLGHVDHGKTSLLDRIIGLDVVAGEAGGITQHIRAYQAKKDGRYVSFVDTPGHEAFTEMRARGANVTDIAVLVVAADDGVMPQTEEAISHARAAEVPIVVALNKIDLPGVDPNKALQDLSTHNLLPAEWGGDVEVVRTSAITGDGIDDLMETLLLTADLHEYKANPHRDAVGTCLESQQEGNRGVVAKLIVQNGTLNVGDVIVCGSAFGKVKAMYDALQTKKKVKSAGPSTPVNVMGLDTAPDAGERFYVLKDISQAREIAEQREQRSREDALGGVSIKISFDELQRRLEEGRLTGSEEDIVTLNLIVRADVRGSIEAIRSELDKFDHPEVQIRLLQATVGGITVADVTLADASNAVIVGFNVIPDEAARSLADERGVEIRRYDIIYKLTEDIKSMIEGKLKPEERVKELGRALVQQVFTISKVGTVAGCRVLAGTIERGCRIRVNRDGRGIGDYPLDSVKREKDDVKEVREGFECGIKLSGFNDVKEGDILEAYKIEEVARTL